MHTSRGGFGRPSLAAKRGRSHRGLLVVVAIAVGLFAAQAHAASGAYVLKSHLAKMPRATHASAAAGSLTGMLKLAGDDSSFTWTLKFGHLSGTALRAGIYYGKVAKPSQLAMLLCNKCISGANSYYHGSYVASPPFVRAIRHGGAYVIIQTKRNPKGEIRGQIKATAA